MENILKLHWLFLSAGFVVFLGSCKSTSAPESVTFELNKTFEVHLPAGSPVDQDILSFVKIDIQDSDLTAHSTSLSKITSVKLSTLNFLAFTVDPHERTPTPDYFIDSLRILADPLSLAQFNTKSTTVTNAEFSSYVKNPNNQFFVHTFLQHTPVYDVMARFNYVLTIIANTN